MCVTSLPADTCSARTVYERLYGARGNMENTIKEQQLDLFSDYFLAQIKCCTKPRSMRSWLLALTVRQVDESQQALGDPNDALSDLKRGFTGRGHGSQLILRVSRLVRCRLSHSREYSFDCREVTVYIAYVARDRKPRRHAVPLFGELDLRILPHVFQPTTKLLILLLQVAFKFCFVGLQFGGQFFLTRLQGRVMCILTFQQGLFMFLLTLLQALFMLLLFLLHREHEIVAAIALLQFKRLLAGAGDQMKPPRKSRDRHGHEEIGG